MKVQVLNPELVLEAIVSTAERDSLVFACEAHRRRNFGDAVIDRFGESGVGEKKASFDLLR